MRSLQYDKESWLMLIDAIGTIHPSHQLTWANSLCHIANSTSNKAQSRRDHWTWLSRIWYQTPICVAKGVVHFTVIYSLTWTRRCLSQSLKGGPIHLVCYNIHPASFWVFRLQVFLHAGLQLFFAGYGKYYVSTVSCTYQRFYKGQINWQIVA